MMDDFVFDEPLDWDQVQKNLMASASKSFVIALVDDGGSQDVEALKRELSLIADLAIHDPEKAKLLACESIDQHTRR